MKPEDIEFIKTITPEMISKDTPGDIKKLVEIAKELILEIETLKKEEQDLKAENSRLKKSQGYPEVRGKRQKPVGYIPGKDRI